LCAPGNDLLQRAATLNFAMLFWRGWCASKRRQGPGRLKLSTKIRTRSSKRRRRATGAGTGSGAGASGSGCRSCTTKGREGARRRSSFGRRSDRFTELGETERSGRTDAALYLDQRTQQNRERKERGSGSATIAELKTKRYPTKPLERKDGEALEIEVRSTNRGQKRNPEAQKR